MNHNECKELLSALLDGELAENERAEVLAHLETCAECRTYFAELNEMHDAFGDMEPIDVPEGFAAGVLARLHEEEAPKSAKKFNPWKRYGALAACAAVVVLAAAVLNGGMFGGSGAPKNAAADDAPPQMAQAVEAPQSAVEAENYLMTTMTAESAADENAPDEAGINSAIYAAEGVDTDAAPAEPAEPSAAPEARAGGDSGAGNGTEETANVPDAPAGDSASAKFAGGVLTLSGAGAEDWLRANGTWSEAEGWYLVPVDALDTLPDSLTLEGVTEPVDGMVPVAAAETEAAP